MDPYKIRLSISAFPALKQKVVETLDLLKSYLQEEQYDDIGRIAKKIFTIELNGEQAILSLFDRNLIIKPSYYPFNGVAEINTYILEKDILDGSKKTYVRIDELTIIINYQGAAKHNGKVLNYFPDDYYTLLLKYFVNEDTKIIF